MKKFLVLILILIQSCGQTNKAKTEINWDNLQKFKIEFLDGQIVLPTNFERITAEQLKEKGLALMENPRWAEIFSSGIDQMTIAPNGYDVFVNIEDISNYVWVRRDEYVPLDKPTGNLYLGMLSQSLAEQWGTIGINYERLENKFVQTRNSVYIKVKYRTEFEGYVRYQTQYVITSKFKTFDFQVLSRDDVDFEELIKYIELR